MAFYRRLVLASASASLFLAASALADSTAPSVAVTLDGVVVGNPVPVLDQESGHWFVENYYFSNSEGQINLNLDLDPDPVLAYNGSIIDFGGPSVFGFIFGLPIVATPATGIVTHQESSSTTEGTNGGGTPVT